MRKEIGQMGSLARIFFQNKRREDIINKWNGNEEEKYSFAVSSFPSIFFFFCCCFTLKQNY